MCDLVAGRLLEVRHRQQVHQEAPRLAISWQRTDPTYVLGHERDRGHPAIASTIQL